MKLEMDFAKYKTLQHFDNLVKKVSKDIDKKSTYSKKMQSEHQKEQDQKNKTLVEKVIKPDDIFTMTTKGSTRDFFGSRDKRAI